MIDALAPDRSDQSFGKAILPRRGWCSRLVPDAHGAQSACDYGAVDAISVTDQVLWILIPGECIGNLTRDPFCRWICCDIDPNELSAVQPNDDEGIEQVEANGRDNEQIHGGDVRRVITQKSTPSLARRSTPLDHVLGNARLGDFKPELEQFAMNARCSPQWVIDAHFPDQRPQLRIDPRPPAKRARLPTPVTTKAGLMPTHDRLGTNDDEGLQGRWKPTIQQDKEQAIVVREPNAAVHLTPQNDQLMS